MGGTQQLSPLEQLAGGAPQESAPSQGDLSPLEQLAQTPPPAESSGAPLPQVTTSTNPKLAEAMAQKDAGEGAGAVALGAPVALAGAAAEPALLAAAPKIAQIIQSTAQSHPIIAKLLVKALEGTALAKGLQWGHIIFPPKSK